LRLIRNLPDLWNLEFDFFSPKTIFVEPVHENLSTDGGLLIFRQFEEWQGLRIKDKG